MRWRVPSQGPAGAAWMIFLRAGIWRLARMWRSTGEVSGLAEGASRAGEGAAGELAELAGGIFEVASAVIFAMRMSSRASPAQDDVGAVPLLRE